MKSQPALKANQTALIGALAASVFSWFAGPLRMVLLPALYLDTQLHELCHALTAVATGGHVMEIFVNANASGLTETRGGLQLLVASAGYVGSTIFGAGMISRARTPMEARRVLKFLGGLVVFSAIVWVRGDSVGVISGIVWPIALFVLASRLKDSHVLFAAIFIGVELCLSSFLHLFSLLHATVGTETFSDALAMQQMTLVPAIFWALLWCGFSAVLCVLAFRSVFRDIG